MKIKPSSILILLLSIFLTSCDLPFIAKKNAGLQISSSPNTGIFLNDKHVGSTVYDNDKIQPGEYTIKLVPESGLGLSWESKVNLISGVTTVIFRQLGQSEETSSGYILTLEPSKDKENASLEIVTDPDKAVVNIDGEPKGFSALALDKLSPGQHVILITAPGYIEKSINANLRKGYTLRASVQLARSEIEIPVDNETEIDIESEESKEETLDQAEESPKPSDSPTPKVTTKVSATPKAEIKLDPPYITVLETDTGYLNVRETPSTGSDNVIAKIKPGESYPFIEKNNTGWYKIEITDDEEGWISGKYVKLVE